VRIARQEIVFCQLPRRLFTYLRMNQQTCVARRQAFYQLLFIFNSNYFYGKIVPDFARRMDI